MTDTEQSRQIKVSKWRIALSLSILVAFALFVSTQFGELDELLSLIGHANGWLLLVALALQIVTYVCDGAKWHISVKPNGYHLSLGSLTKLAIEQLSMNQFIPSVGMAGNAIVAREMLRLNIPAWVVAKAMSIDILTLLSSYTVMTATSIYFLWDLVNVVVIWILSAFLVFMILVTVSLWHFVHNHRKWRVLNWFKRWKFVRLTLDVMSQIPEVEIIPWSLFFQASLLRLAIFVLDGLTLLVIMFAIGVPVGFAATLIALAGGSIGGVLSVLPGGVGGFEAASTGILVALGTPLEAALAGTLILRGLILWLPLIPGLIFIRKEIFPYKLSA